MRYSLSFINSDNEKIDFYMNGNYIIRSAEGLSGAFTDLYTTKAPLSDGELYISNTLEPRNVVVNGSIIAGSNSELEDLKSALTHICNPKTHLGKLIFTDDYKQREISAMVDVGPVYLRNRGRHTENTQDFSIEFYCPQPFWIGDDIYSKQLVSWVGGMTFPVTFPTKFATKWIGESIEVENTSDVAVPVTITFSGLASNPIIINETTDQFIKVNRDMLETDQLIINTEFGNKSVTIVHADGTQENAFNYIDLQSEFWLLQRGINLISYASEYGVGETEVIVEWKNRYLTV